MEDAALSPTLEQLKRDEYIPPQVDRETNRRTWKKVSTFEGLFNRGEIDMAQLEASRKLQRHYEGSLGYDVRLKGPGEGRGGHSDEFPRTVHTRILEDAKSVLLPREWLALFTIIQGADTVEGIGRKWKGCGSRQLARAHGVALISLGLERLAAHWGLSNEKKR